MGDVLLPLAVLATLVTVLVGLWAVVLARRLVLARGVGTFDCSLRRPNRRGRGRWVLGVARYEADRLDWFPGLTVRPRPTPAPAAGAGARAARHRRPARARRDGLVRHPAGLGGRHLRLRDVDPRARHERRRLQRPGRLAGVGPAPPHRPDRLTPPHLSPPPLSLIMHSALIMRRSVTVGHLGRARVVTLC